MTSAPRAVFAYGAALLLGAALALWVFPLDVLFPRAGFDWRPVGDTAQHIVAQRYLLAEPWRWPPTLALTLNTQEGGVNTVFADVIPLLTLALKTIRGVLPPGFHGVGLFGGLAWLLQPVAAVWALRGAGETRLLPAIGVALAAASMPAFIGRFGHAALTGHFVLLVALGFYLRLVVRPNAALWAAAILAQVATLLIHPYLAAMSLALLGAVPLTRLLRGNSFLASGVAVGVALVAMVGVMAGFGYLGAAGDGGYGQFAMNLLSPVWPAGSGLIGWPWSPQLDATGHGGWEGYNWLGFGLLAALLVGVLARPGVAFAGMRAHAGLVLALFALTLLAVSHKVGFGDRLILDLGQAPGFLEQFRSSGRFFWPVAYGLLIGGFVLLARISPALCLVAGLLQFADAAPLRRAIADWAAARPPWTVDAPALRDAFAGAQTLTLLPSWPCVDAARDGDTLTRLLEVLALASERAVPVSTMYVARWRNPPVCRDATLASAPLAPGEVRLILPLAQPSLAPLVPDAVARCGQVGDVTLCR
ncbi:DUF6311 domain-containing protein [Humitalea sp. 24SJ18S-53]|uniref:DUF6311 domain-containing protein n=1 Tax=Humitalea sp. 24SJ18S-53 TaxID=3422307 RepID=UPI003D670F53